MISLWSFSLLRYHYRNVYHKGFLALVSTLVVFPSFKAFSLPSTCDAEHATCRGSWGISITTPYSVALLQFYFAFNGKLETEEKSVSLKATLGQMLPDCKFRLTPTALAELTGL